MAKSPTMSDSFDSAMRSSKMEGDEARFMAAKPKPKDKRPSIGESVASGNRMSKEDTKDMAAVKKYAKGGSASSRADGCVTKGRTKGKMV
jgi:hypothetical protein